MNTFQDVHNIYPDVRITLFARDDKQLIDTLRNESFHICRDLISNKYISSSFLKFKQGYLVNAHDGKRLGFVIWKINKDMSKMDNIERKHMFIYLICSRQTEEKVGRVLLHAIDTYCQQHNIVSIQLEPANEALISVYESYGYEKSYVLRKLYMTKYIDPIYIKKTKYTRKIKRTLNLPTID